MDRGSNLDRPMVTEIGKKPPRKRLKQEGNWERNVRKRKVNSGQAHVSETGNYHREKRLQESCDELCKLRCSRAINVEQRKAIFQSYYDLSDKTRQREFIARCMKISPKKGKLSLVEKLRKRCPNFYYYFDVDRDQVRVCKKFFKNTLDISNNTIATVWKKMDGNGFLEEDRRGKHGKHKKVDEEILDGVREHINSVMSIESHLICTEASRVSTDGVLNLSAMYRQYVRKCTENGVSCAKKYLYDSIFNAEFNVGFVKKKRLTTKRNSESSLPDV